ncbi:hypothetical protein FHP25_29800 [Vineibacter terrae]|uniref:Uncharacterized protein n=1 Tax=Vineibacter terrae TaxID=2586908 RepID=A0A5C8PEJ6_9HYPH|nr:hypothetical protein [Vineibacter terrae]TXL71571.1 hypothetical protein FHP25_29800 [Vineibacter terrae]
MPRPQQRTAGPAEPAGTDSGNAADDAAPQARQPRSAAAWSRSGAGYSTTIDGRAYRVTKYPADSALDAPYGAYAEGRFIGSGSTLESVKSRCTAHAGRLRLRPPLRHEA